jgi:hypothetical protein
MNIKKNERVYWVSEDEIGIIFYEIKSKNEDDFINFVIKNKLINEIGDPDASTLLNNINFVMVKIENVDDDLLKIESKARIKLITSKRIIASAKGGKLNDNPRLKK